MSALYALEIIALEHAVIVSHITRQPAVIETRAMPRNESHCVDRSVSKPSHRDKQRFDLQCFP